MRTAVQLRPTGAPSAALLYGLPEGTREGRLGPIALFPGGELVAYEIVSRRRRCLYVFRTLEVDDRLAASVPGVHPRVHLLLNLYTAGRIRMVRHLLAHLKRVRRDPSGLPDDFFSRAGVLLAGRVPARRVLYALLPPPTPLE